MEFKRWNSIENHYQKGIFEKWMNFHPDVNSCEVEVTEKIHGSNFSIIGTPDGEVVFASRNGILEPDAKFNGFQDVFKRLVYVELIDYIKILAEEIKKEVQVYGEFYGAGIQKGVFYGDEKNFRWYSVRIDGDVIPPALADEAMHFFAHLKAPVIGRYNVGGDLIKFIDEFDTKFDSRLTPKEYEGDNICEGVVIVPYFKNFYNQESILLIKKKNDEFKDKMSKPKNERKPKEALPDNIREAIDEAHLYLNEVRTNDLYSKMGKMESMKDCAGYAKAYFEDLFLDFEKDNYTMWHELEKDEQGQVKKAIGPLIYKELKESLNRS